ncbi:butyrophilin subfamily 3 member A2 isoform X1 [Xenopus laevis]|uniref:Butyrophilin subfamily 3 member A2 isoform X1 n=2 Tax=Xenopus laevis TaxID=8355 RepID=A0A8J1LK37_XENLA|nr:butyrophilin subfamily 3 member A2 isoform X1 [Xenopus laevis]
MRAMARLRLNIFFKCILVLRNMLALYKYMLIIIIITLLTSLADSFTVIASHTPVIVTLGKEANLSCHLDPAVSAKDMRIKFYQRDPNSYVSVYNKGQTEHDNQDEKYKDRTEILKENITRGEVGVRIKNVMMSDTGKYTCQFAYENNYDKARLTLTVAAVGKEPAIHTQENNEAPTGYKTRTCESSGWYPEPKLQWLDGNGNILESYVSIKYIDNITLYQVSSSIKQDDCSPVTCRISNELLNVKHQNSVDVSHCWEPWQIALLVTGWCVVAVAFFVALVRCIYKYI